MQLAVCEFARNVLGWKGEWPHELGRGIWLLPPFWFQSWMNVSRDAMLIRCSLLFLDANSTEFNPESKYPVVRFLSLSAAPLSVWAYTGINWTACLVLQVIEMPEHNPGQMGGTMRLGKRRTVFKSDTSVMSMETAKANIQLSHSTLLQCLTNDFYRKTLRECGFYWREAQTQIWGTVFVCFFFYLCYILPRSIPSVDIKTLILYCLHIGEPCAEGPLCKTRSSVCGSGCAGRKNGDRWTGR